MFLRKIEYFEGILFLTTNQIHFIDPAFESRVTLGIRFEDMGRETRGKIWRKLLEELDDPKRDVKDRLGDGVKSKLLDQVERWSGEEYSLNGRQIRNVVNSAWLLARHGGIARTLDATAIQASLDSVMQFVRMIKIEKERERDSYLEKWSY